MYEKELNIPEGNSLSQIRTESKQKKSEDIDLTWFNELDSDGNIVSEIFVKDATSIYPPSKRYIEYEKKVNGEIVEEKRISM